MTFSIVLAYRYRPALLNNMLRSFVAQTKNINECEIIIGIDQEDHDAFREIPLVNNQYKQIDIKWYIRKHSDHLVRDQYNALARIATGRWILPINDDSDFLTKNWDTIVNRKMSEVAEERKNDILLGLTKDQIPRAGENPLLPHFSSFPVVGKEYVTALGYLWDERCWVWGPDHIIARLFREFSKSNIVSLTEVTIGHNSVHTGRREISENYERFGAIDEKHRVAIDEFSLKSAIKKLGYYLDCKKRSKL
jgi:hypothetical protein